MIIVVVKYLRLFVGSLDGRDMCRYESIFPLVTGSIQFKVACMHACRGREGAENKAGFLFIAV